MKTFYKLLLNNVIASITNMFVWFALTFYVYLATKSVLATSIISGTWAVVSMLSSMLFGTYVDHHTKKKAMLVSTIGSFVGFALGGALYAVTPKDILLDITSPMFWLFVLLLILGSVASNMRGIAMSTCVTLLTPKDSHDKANGLIGMSSGIVWSLTSIFGGLGIGFLGMGWCIVAALVVTLLVGVHLLSIDMSEKHIVHLEEKPKKIDFRGAIAAIKPVPGLMGMIYFATINNFLNGVFISLMDAYGLSLMSVQAWGIFWSVLSLGFIVGGSIVAKKGLGKNPVALIFQVNIVLWIVTIFFTIRQSSVFLAVGMFIYMCLIPVVEAAEQTVIQKVVPLKSQGRVFGFAQTVEQAASPLTAFMIGPIAQLFAIPFMSGDGLGARAIGSWFGTGQPRGIALIFTLAGVVGLIITLLAFSSKTYKNLVHSYAN